MKDLTSKRVLVAGMARSGLAAAALLLQHGAIVKAMDQHPEKVPPQSYLVVPQNIEALSDVDLIVLSPGIPLDIPELDEARRRGIPIVGEVELAAWFLQGPIIGITGSNGKTTTTAMIGHILQKAALPVQVGGNIGTPPTSMVESSRAGQWNVLELSSFQLETISEFQANVAVCLNVTPDHLDRHHTFENYANAKARLFETQAADGFAILNVDNQPTAAFASRTKAQVIWFSTSHQVDRGAWLREDGRIFFDDTAVMLAKEIPLRGIHNVENALAAIGACRCAGVPLPRIADALRTFPGVEHRIEFVRELNGVRYYNDSKATNVDATEKAVDAFDEGLWLILGGKDKNSDYTVLFDKLQKKARAIMLIGAAANIIARQLEGLPLVQCGTMDAAIRFAHAAAAPGEVVLLSPACASFDQFENYEHRGTVFKNLVNGM